MADGFKEYDFDPRNLPQDLLGAIGLMTTSAAQTEGIIEWAIAGCLGLDMEYGMAVTTHMAMPLRFSVLRSAAEIRIDEIEALSELDDLLELLEEAFNKRNAIVHHTWCRDPKTQEVFTVKTTARTSVQQDLIPMTVQHVKRDALFVYEAGMKLMGFLKRLNLAPPPPPFRPRGHKSKIERKKRRKALLERGA